MRNEDKISKLVLLIIIIPLINIITSFMPPKYDHIPKSIQGDTVNILTKQVNYINMKQSDTLEDMANQASNLASKLLNMSRQTIIPSDYNSACMDLFTVAIGEYDQSEISGNKNNPEISKYGIPFGGDGTDSQAWCSSFINWCAKESGYEYTGKLNARSWLNIGTNIPKEDWRLGDVVVLWRGSISSWTGHVGLYVRHDENYVYLLGGNQSDKVSIQKYALSRVLGVQRLSKIAYK